MSSSHHPTHPIDGIARQLQLGEDVLGDWYESEYGQVHRLALGFCGNSASADDLATDAMLHLIDHLGEWDSQRPYGPWRTRVVLNLARDARRASGRRARHEQAAGELWQRRELPDPSEVAAARDVRSVLQSCLGALPDREREVFVLVDLEGSTAQEAAEVLGIAASTVRAALSLSRRRLRELLAPKLGADGVGTAGGPA